MYENREQYLASLKSKLLAYENRKPVELTLEWAKKAPDQAGVYVLLLENEVVYAGETGELSGRLKDLRLTVNHSVRRTLGKLLFSKEEGYEDATSKKPFPLAIEFKLDEYMRKNLQIAYLTVNLGRKELEEAIVADIPQKFKLNVRSKRGSRKSK